MTDVNEIRSTPTSSASPIRLTQTVQKGGCAAKVAAVELRKILGQVRFPKAKEELLIGSATFDDAAVYRLPNSPTTALVQTLDFFTPIVDSPYLFGQIAAANALSDVYAMGGTPLTAMAIFAFPIATLDSSVAVDVLQGGADVIARANAALVGGHTIDDDTMKFGLSVTGLVDPKRVWSNAGARPGDHLILTKALGTGTLTAALKRGEVTEEDIEICLQSMCTLNDVLSILDPQLAEKIHAATDITGFGLSGHSLNMARASRVELRIETSRLPVLPRALEFIERGFLTKAHRTNREYVLAESKMSIASNELAQLIHDPQTSGGLLLSVDPAHSADIIHSLKKTFHFASVIGEVSSTESAGLNFT